MAVIAIGVMAVPEQLTTRIIGWSLIILLDIIAAWGLFYIFESVNKEISALAALIRLVYVAILSIAMACLLIAKNVVEVDIQSVFLNSFESIWSWGLIIFGLHLLLIGFLSIKNKIIPTWLGYTIILGGLGYFIVHLARLTTTSYEPVISMVEMVFMAPMIVGELGLAIFLIIKSKR
jgi:hypothetical protein